MRDAPGRLTEQEIRAQPRLWTAILSEVPAHLPRIEEQWRSAAPEQILLTGCGSSYYLALAAAHVLRAALHVPCLALPSSEILFAGAETMTGTRPLLAIAISRSGETTETVWAVQRLREVGAATVALTCSEGGSLSRASDLSIVLPVEERSVVMTGSFTSMLLGLALVAATLSSDAGAVDGLRRLPDLAGRELEGLSGRARTLAEAVAGVCVYLGSGPMYGIACEGALKMTEMALVPGCAYHTLEYLHGPKAALSPQTLIVGLLSSRGAPYEAQVLKHLAALGATVVAVGSPVDGLPAVRLAADPGALGAMLLAEVWMQLLALYAARVRGVDPDAPRFLQPVVTWDQSLQIGGVR